MYYLTNCTSTRPTLNTSYETAINFIEDRDKKVKIFALLNFLFRQSVQKINYTSTDTSVEVTVEHSNTKGRPLLSHRTVIYVPSKVQFTVNKNGGISFNDPTMAPYEQVELLSYFTWKKIDIVDTTVHISSSHSVSCYYTIADLGENFTTIPLSTLQNI